jgi:hypothetical protein
VLPLEFKPAHTVADLLVQHLEALEQDATEKGDRQQLLANRVAEVYKVGLTTHRAAQRREGACIQMRKRSFRTAGK